MYLQRLAEVAVERIISQTQDSVIVISARGSPSSGSAQVKSLSAGETTGGNWTYDAGM